MGSCREKSLEERQRQVAKLFLRRWQYYEKHSISLMSTSHQQNIVYFFNGLKQLSEEEVALLSERYYKSTDYCHYDEELDDFRNAKPVPLKKLALKFGKDVSEVMEIYKVVEAKFGKYLALQYPNMWFSK